MSSAVPVSGPLTAVVADDHRIVRDGLRVLAERSGCFRVIGEAVDGRRLVEQVAALRPDMVVTDWAMSGLNGTEATRQLRAGGFAGIVVMLSAYEDRQRVAEALAAGVSAYVHKENALEEIETAVAAARRGEIWLSPRIARLGAPGEIGPLAALLSDREREVLQLFAEGRNTKEIAAVLLLSPKTIEVHRLRLFAKLKVNNVVDLTRLAIREGLVEA